MSSSTSSASTTDAPPEQPPISAPPPPPAAPPQYPSHPQLTWQSDNDVPHRRQMTLTIIRLLEQRKPEATEEWKARLPSMAKTLEDKLYKTASCFDVYADEKTLKRRLQLLALAPGSSQQQAADRQQVLRHQQQRLLLLRHAAKCPHESNTCPVTPHCAGMKRLWMHIADCKDQKCQVPHCVSSRYVLSHYHKCKDVRCPVCGPVREEIQRSVETQMAFAEASSERQMEQTMDGVARNLAADSEWLRREGGNTPVDNEINDSLVREKLFSRTASSSSLKKEAVADGNKLFEVRSERTSVNTLSAQAIAFSPLSPSQRADVRSERERIVYDMEINPDSYQLSKEPFVKSKNPTSADIYLAEMDGRTMCAKVFELTGLKPDEKAEIFSTFKKELATIRQCLHVSIVRVFGATTTVPNRLIMLLGLRSASASRLRCCAIVPRG